jgi:hypothetical protein
MKKSTLQAEFEKEFSVWNNKWIFATRPKEQNTATTEDVFFFFASRFPEMVMELVDNEIKRYEYPDGADYMAVQALQQIKHRLVEDGWIKE